MRTTFFALPILIAALALPSPATAGEYVVHSCRLPDGRPAPADGWSTTGYANNSSLANSCAGGGALTAELGGANQPANVAPIGWAFDSGGAEIRGYSIERSGTATASGWGTTAVLFTANRANDSTRGDAIDYCATYQGCTAISGRLERTVPQLPSALHNWFMTVVCGGYADYTCAPTFGAKSLGSLKISAASFTLGDDAAPAAANIAGPLAAGGAISGTLTFDASDAGSGVFRAALEVDGTEVASATPSTNDGRCVRIGLAGSQNDFVYRRPCPAAVQVELALPDGVVAAGTHTIRARVYDAAKNGTTVLSRSVNVPGPSAVSAQSATPRSQPSRRIVLRALHNRIHAFGRLILRGRISGGRLSCRPPVLIQVRAARRWRTVAVRRASTAGNFRFRYRFKRTRHATLRFRAASAGSSCPVPRPSASRTVGVRIT
jgi:hypothetical protein